MAEDLRELKRKIGTIRSIRKITRAMKMVAAAKLNRVRGSIDNGRAYWDALDALMQKVAARSETISHPLLEPNDAEAIAVLAVGGERGLCGSYNVHINNHVEEFLQQQDRPVKMWVIGDRLVNFLNRRGYELANKLEMPDQNNRMDVATDLSATFRKAFLDSEFGQVHVIYTEFHTPIRHFPVTELLLPIRPEDIETEQAQMTEYIFEPPAEELLGTLLPRAIDSMVYRMLLEAAASEQGARMTAMTAATDNADEMIENLTRRRNRARQAEITGEILDIVGGAEALQTTR